MKSRILDEKVIVYSEPDASSSQITAEA